MASGNFNMDDPSKQEAIRRGHHEYIPTAGKHGSYVPKQYRHQEYPKMLGTWAKPAMENFTKQNGVQIPQDLALQQFQAAMTEWDRAMSNSVVKSKAEEAQWLKENA
jgi:hypothetical protein